tara:strand:- start:30 stop:779 length:750 start_codon:yes stop_codon:yes gene_type:complete
LKILLIGDSCEDIYHFGTTDRISPEAPVPVFQMINSVSHVGMASNVRENLKNFFVQVDFLTNKEKIYKERYIDNLSKQHLLRVDKGENKKINPLEIDTLKSLDIESYDGILLSDYDKGFINSQLVKYITKNFHKPIFVDSKKEDLSSFEGCIIKLNEKESKNLDKLPGECELIVTLGSRGALWDKRIFPCSVVDIFDPCGAGDTFFAALAVKYLLEENIENAIKFANKCATITVQKLGTYAPSLEEVLN